MITAGLHRIPAAQYHSDPAPQPSLSSSVANTLVSRSPHHAWTEHPRLNPNWKPSEASDKMDYGSAVHSMLLEKDTDSLAIVDATDWRTKAAQQAREDARTRGKTPILHRQFLKVDAMCQAVGEYLDRTELKGVFEDGDAELSVFTDERGLWLRARPDWLTTDRKICLDYKTTTCAEPDAFIGQIVRMGYDVQCAFYLRVLAAHGIRPHFVFLAQETEPPFACSLVGLGEQMLEVARRKVDFAIATWASCLKSGKWSGYPTEICWGEPKAWDAAKWLDEPLEEAA